MDTGYTVTGLKKFTEYIVWVVAYNHNGAGHNSEEITVKTLSDIPSEPPTNVTVEASSSTVSYESAFATSYLNYFSPDVL